MLSKPMSQSMSIPGAIKALESTSEILQAAGAEALEHYIDGTADVVVARKDFINLVVAFGLSASSGKNQIADTLIAALARNGQNAEANQIREKIYDAGRAGGVNKLKTPTL